MITSDAEKLNEYEKALKIAKEYDFIIVPQNDSIMVGRPSWSYPLPMKTIGEALKFLEGFEYGFRAGKKSNT